MKLAETASLETLTINQLIKARKLTAHKINNAPNRPEDKWLLNSRLECIDFWIFKKSQTDKTKVHYENQV